MQEAFGYNSSTHLLPPTKYSQSINSNRQSARVSPPRFVPPSAPSALPQGVHSTYTSRLLCAPTKKKKKLSFFLQHTCARAVLSLASVHVWCTPTTNPQSEPPVITITPSTISKTTRVWYTARRRLISTSRLPNIVAETCTWHGKPDTIRFSFSYFFVSHRAYLLSPARSAIWACCCGSYKRSASTLAAFHRTSLLPLPPIKKSRDKRKTPPF